MHWRLFLCFNIIMIKLTATIVERIVTAVEVSKLPLYRIAAYSGITYQTLRNWLRDGEDHQKQLEDGKIKKGDLNPKQKRELELYFRVEVARTTVEAGYLARIREIAEKKEDIRAFQWLLKIQDPFYRDAEIEGGESARQSVQVVVVNLSDCGGGNAQLLTEFVRGSVNDGKKKEGDTEDTSDSV